MTKRLENWPLRMETAIDAARVLPFGYGPGQYHCCLFTGNVIEAMTGGDPIAWFRGRYTTERGAYLALKRFAGGDVPEAAAKIAEDFGCVEIAPTLAGRGDAVLFDTPDGPAMGICIGPQLVSVTKPNGLAFLPMIAATRAWKV
jgi:hypothetical protein